MIEMKTLLEQSAALHKHLCPRQVLGVRMGMMAEKILEFELPQTNKRLLTIVESDGCFADGVSVATGCWVGRRTLRMEDFGKIAATFIDTRTERAVRIAPRHDVRQLAAHYAPEARTSWQAQLLGYQSMPFVELLNWQWVGLTMSLKQIISRPKLRTNCEMCGEEIINQREVVIDRQVLCCSCAGSSYYSVIVAPIEVKTLAQV